MKVNKVTEFSPETLSQINIRITERARSALKETASIYNQSQGAVVNELLLRFTPQLIKEAEKQLEELQ